MDNVASPVDVERLWRRIGRGAGYLGAICLAVATLLYLLINIVVVTAMRFLERALAVPGYITGK